MHTRRSLLFCLLSILLLAGSLQAQVISPLPETRPEFVGFSAERLKRFDEGMQSMVEAYGLRDFADAKPMEKDTIFRIYSMTKPITGVAMMILFEEGKWRPSDPIAKYIPEFADLKVYAGQDADGKLRLEAPTHAPTMGELMSHTAGFTYGYFGDTPVDKMYQKDNPLQAGSLSEFIKKLAALPLVYQPGEGWIYSVGVDVQGYLVEKLSGKPLPEFLRDRIFAPLGMVDTGFFIPEHKMSRLATVYTTDSKNPALTAVPHDAGVSKAPELPSGGGGLYSTAMDYMRFAQMLLNGGQLSGARILSPGSVQLMRSNHLPERLMVGKYGIGLYTMQEGLGFGYDFAVFEDPVKIGSTAGKGTYLWDGVAGTWFWIDPTNDIVFIGMIQRMMTAPGAPNMEDLSRALLYQALVDPKK
jgi:CubicO group peptidase (beta-lactamase class C family)